jgi:two-component system, NarL family, sensor histidine kinase ComP
MKHKTISKEDLRKELQKLQYEYDLLKASYEKEITERKLAEEELPEPGIHDQELMDLSRDAIFSLTPQGLFGSMNQAFGKITGWQTQEWIGKPFTDLLHPEDIPLGMERFSNILKGHTAEAIELRIRKKSGDYVWTEVLGSPRMQKGIITGLLGIGRDITERKLAEDVLRRSEIKLKTLFEVLPVGVSIIDAERNIIFVNSALERILNITKDGLIRGDFKSRKYIRPDGTQMPEEEFASVRAIKEQRAVCDVETGVVMEDGKVIWTDVNAVPVAFPDWKVVITTMDITERKLAEEALQHEKNFAESIIETAQVIILVLDKQGHIIRFNPYTEEIFGYKLAEVRGKDWFSIFLPKSDVEEVRSLFLKAISDIQTRGYINRIVTRDGSERQIDWYDKTLKDMQGNIVGLLSVGQDITERKQAEEALRASKQKTSDALEFNRKILDTSSIGILTYRKSGQCISANVAAAQMTGATVEQLQAQNFHEISSWKKSGMYQAAIKALDTGIEQLLDAHLVTTFGKNVWLSFSFTSFDSTGERHLLVFAYDITERKLAEKSLQESEERFRRLYQQAPLGYQSLDAEGCFIDVNQAWLDLFQYRRDEVIGHWFGDFLAPQEVEAFRQRFQYFKETGKVHVDLEMIQRTGSGIIVHIDGKIGYDEHGQFKQTHCILYNITDRKLAETALRESEERYRRLVEGSPDAIAVHSKGKFVFVNSAGVKLIGAQSPQELIGKSILDVVHPDSRSEVIDRLRYMAEGKEAPLFEEKFVKFDGSVINVEVVGIPFTYLGQIATQVVVRDITERKLAEEALNLEKENFRYSLDDSPLGVRIATIEGNTIYANKALLDFYGYDSLDELQKTPLKKRYTTESYIQAQARKRQRKQGDFSATDYEVSIVRKNGEIRHLQVFRKEVLWDGVRQFQVICSDITGRKLADEEIRKSKKLLEDLNKHLDEIRENERALISREIHDQIGQSLTALKLDMNWMHKYLNTSPEAATKLEGMIELITNTIKDVQRISSDLRPGILDDLGLAAAIEWYCDEFEKRTAIKCILKLDDSIFGDPQKNLVLFRVLQEALTNVIRHANASSVTIKLHQTQKGTMLAIQDDGTGITKEKVESTKSLGLIGMRERLKQFGGEIDLSSKEGHGAKLTIFIPERKKSVK